MNRDPKELSSFIEAVAHHAGEILLNHFGGSLTRHIKSHEEDFATEADLAAESMIIAAIQKQFPDDNIIAEESGKQEKGTTGYTWIIDPLDGTFNFANNINDFGTMIAVASGETLQAAVVYNPSKKLLAVASAGNGVALNGAAITFASQHTSQELQKVLTGLAAPTPPLHMQAVREKLDEHNWRPKKLRSAAARVLQVLQSRNDIDISLAPGKVWDFAAPALLLAESGLLVSSLRGQPYSWDRDQDGYVAASPALHREIFQSQLP